MRKGHRHKPGPRLHRVPMGFQRLPPRMDPMWTHLERTGPSSVDRVALASSTMAMKVLTARGYMLAFWAVIIGRDVGRGITQGL